MIKFDCTSHFIIVLCLMVILVSTLINNNKFLRKFKMEYGAFYVICPRASSQYVTPLERHLVYSLCGSALNPSRVNRSGLLWMLLVSSLMHLIVRYIRRAAVQHEISCVHYRNFPVVVYLYLCNIICDWCLSFYFLTASLFKQLIIYLHSACSIFLFLLIVL